MSEERMTRILTLLPEEEAVSDLEPFLSRSTMEITHAASGEEARLAASGRRFDLAMARLPLPDMAIETLISSLRSGANEGRPLPIILMAEKSAFAAGDLVNVKAPLVRPVALDEGDEPLKHAISEALGVAARLAVRIPVRLDVSIDHGRTFRYCETRNLSLSGMLISANKTLPIGADFSFELILPYSYVSLRGFAEVVRVTNPTRENVAGFGAKFVELTKVDSVRIESFIRSKVTPAPPSTTPDIDGRGAAL